MQGYTNSDFKENKKLMTITTLLKNAEFTGIFIKVQFKDTNIADHLF